MQGSLQYPRNSMKGASEHFTSSRPFRAAGQCFSWPRGFSRSKRSWLCAAQNFQAGGTCCNSAQRELEIIAKPLRLLRESLLSGRSFLAACAQKLATTPCPCSLSPAICQFVLVAARRFLQSVTYFVGLSARAPSCRFAFAAFDLLICTGVEAGPWPGWVGLRSKLLIDVAMKISMSQIL